MSIDLESRLRAACSAVLEELEHQPTTGRPSAPPKRRWIAPAAAAALLAVGAVGVWQIVDRPADTNPANAPSTAPALEPGGAAFDRLPVVGGASDYYVGPAELGPPVINRDLFDNLIRCAAMNLEETACAQLEGIAGVPLVRYSTGITIETTGRSEASFEVQIGTTFTEISPEEFANEWAWLGDEQQTPEPTPVHGHLGVRYLNEQGQPAITWQERPGVLVWVAVPPEDADRLLDIASGIQAVAGPDTIPDRRVLPWGDPGPWRAQNNNAAGFIVGRVGGRDCYGYQYIQSCDDTIAGRTFFADGFIVSIHDAGVAVRLERADGTIDVAGGADGEGGAGGFEVRPGETGTVSWINAAGEVIASMPWTAPADSGAG